ncbi:MAG: hypothetical protein KGS48_05415 [Bacteroidetes bacterium]|nr:hypothetical protein [Bacteroidota bacterium]
MMKKQLLGAIFAMVSLPAFAQIPFEVMVGNKQTQYFGYVQKDLDSVGRWNIFSQSIYAIQHKDKSLNSISIDGQLTCMLNNYIGIAAGGAFDGQQFNPTLGLSLTYVNDKRNFVITAFPTLQWAKPMALDLFALVNYTPQFNKNWGLFLQIILGTNLGLQKEQANQKREILNVFTRHNGSTQMVRLGLNFRQKFQFGLGADLAQFGMNEGMFENFGLFVRCQIE